MVFVLQLAVWFCQGLFVRSSVARCAIFPPNLAIFWFGWRVKFAFGGWRIFWLFLQYFGGKFGGFCVRFRPAFGSSKSYKYHTAPNSFSRLCKLFVPVPVVSVQWTPCVCVKLGFIHQLDTGHLTGRILGLITEKLRLCTFIFLRPSNFQARYDVPSVPRASRRPCVRCDSTVCTPSASTAFTNWFCKNCMVPIWSREKFFIVHRIDKLHLLVTFNFLVSYHGWLFWL